jgi:hypothetical protein
LLKKWNPDIEMRLKEILGNTPELEMNWRTWKTELPRREKL